jgi:hypothetical protein
MRLFLLIYFLLIQFVQISFSQAYDFNGQWTTLGPDKKPSEDRRQSANGIGPIEFIAVHPRKKGHLLACALNGGLFYSTNGGEQWINSGSDDWDYSACSWADYHPDNEKIWFANSNITGANGSAGIMGHQGGVYRTMNAGLDWELIADKSAFINSEFMTVYGFKFNPEDSKQLFVNTDEGVYYSTDCLAEKVEWNRVPGIAGWIYDIDMLGSDMYMAHMQFGKWNLQHTNLAGFEEMTKVKFIEDITDPISSITCESYGDSLLVLVNYLRKGDELWKYNPDTQESELLLKNQRIVFGKGRTFAVSPHRSQEIMLGNGTSIYRWDLETRKKISMRGGYHVDIECVVYDPFDSMKVYLATHGGVYTTLDNAESWESTSNGLGVAEVEGIAVSMEDPEQITIGCFHDGSSLRANFDKDGNYYWKNINGGDGLVPIGPPNDPKTVFTSNQYNGGGLYVSKDTGRTKKNIHALNHVSSSGWQMSAVLHPSNPEILFFNYQIKRGEEKDNIDILRTNDVLGKNQAERISNFKESHNIEHYSIFGIYNSKDYPDVLFAHMLHTTQNEKGKNVIVHRLFRNDHNRDSAPAVINGWYEIEIPRSDWIAQVTTDPKSKNRIYVVS